MDSRKLENFVNAAWAHEGTKSPIIAALEEYIAIPNDSPAFDPQWAEHGHMDRAMDCLMAAVERLKAEWAAGGCETGDITLELLGGRSNPEQNGRGERRTPLLLVEIPASGGAGEDSVLLYGHMDKQPALEDKWSVGLGPRTPVIRDGKLYGRGGADDGYALFSALAAVMALRAQNEAHARCVIVIEACEESGSADLEYYIRKSLPKLGKVTLIICLDSGCANYDQLWVTNSLRGMVKGCLSVGVMKEGVHSGDASGVVPSSFRILRGLLSRLEDEASGAIVPRALQVDIPAAVREQAKAVAAVLGDGVYGKFPFLNGLLPVTEDKAELVLNRTWRSALAVIGLDGIPPTKGAGNVMLPESTAGLSMRLAPTLDSGAAARFMKQELEKNPPYNAHVTFAVDDHGDGWAAPAAAPWMAEALRRASLAWFGRENLAMGEGGSIPFMSMLGQLFPTAQFFVTGLLGPHSNAHGPDEFLHIPTARNLTLCVAEVVAAHCGSLFS